MRALHECAIQHFMTEGEVRIIIQCDPTFLTCSLSYRALHSSPGDTASAAEAADATAAVPTAASASQAAAVSASIGDTDIMTPAPSTGSGLLPQAAITEGADIQHTYSTTLAMLTDLSGCVCAAGAGGTATGSAAMTDIASANGEGEGIQQR